MLALAVEAPFRVGNIQVESHSTRDHESASINRGPRRAARSADGVFGTNRGIRVGSALALEADDVDLERGELQLRHTKGDVPTSVPLSRAFRDHLRAYLAGRPSGLLFPISPRHAQRRLEQWCERAGIEHRVRPHDLRHSFAIRIYRKTRDLLLVQQALRHRSIASTSVYARTDDASVRAAMGR
jgi:integrase/recombinase XerD